MQGELCLPGSTNFMSHHLKWLQLERCIKQLEVSHIKDVSSYLNVCIVLQPDLESGFCFPGHLPRLGYLWPRRVQETGRIFNQDQKV